jgi:hypothetical protein
MEEGQGVTAQREGGGGDRMSSGHRHSNREVCEKKRGWRTGAQC